MNGWLTDGMEGQTDRGMDNYCSGGLMDWVDR